MNYENYRRAMDGQTLSDEKKAALSAYAAAPPLRGNHRFARLRRRKIATLTSLAACFTVICIAGAPLLMAATLRCGSAAPESSIPTDGSSDHFLYAEGLLDAENDCSYSTTLAATGALPATEALPTHTASADVNGAYRTIYGLIQPGLGTTSEQSQTTAPESPRPSVNTRDFSADVGTEHNVVSTRDAHGRTGTIVFGRDVRVIALFSVENCLAVCAETGSEVTAFIYDVTDATSPALLGSFGVSGMLTDVTCTGSVVTITTEFTPTSADVDDIEAFIPSIILNSESRPVSPEDISVTYTGSGECTCYVVTSLDLSQNLDLISIKAEFAEK